MPQVLSTAYRDRICSVLLTGAATFLHQLSIFFFTSVVSMPSLILLVSARSTTILPLPMAKALLELRNLEETSY
jgi:hypothetical protein